MELKENKILKERMYIKTLLSGAKCYIIPKNGYKNKEAIIAVDYGSNDISFKENDGERKTPFGVAHFLEHKMFEEKDRDIFAEFNMDGAMVNAFTDFNKTAYYFSSMEKFKENFTRLLNFVQSPYFTFENVENEKGIISQEIKMYDDDPSWIVFFNLLNTLYKNHTVKENIAGTIESIKEIDKDELYACYRKFYCPENMKIVCVGDLDVNKTFKLAEDLIKGSCQQPPEAIYKDEPTDIISNFVEKTMDVSKNIFYIGFKHEWNEDSEKPEKTYGMKMLCDICFGNGSEFYERLYNDGLINEEFGFQYMSGEGFALSVVSGTGEDINKIKDSIYSEIERIKEKGIDDKDFNRIKKKSIGRFIRGFNSIDSIAMSQLELCMRNTDLFEAFDIVSNIKKEDLEKYLKQDLDIERSAVSVINKP